MGGNRLSLSIDDAVVARAKAFALRNRTSVSELVEEFLRSLDQRSGDPVIRGLHEELLAMDHDANQELDIDALKRAHTSAKYGT